MIDLYIYGKGRSSGLLLLFALIVTFNGSSVYGEKIITCILSSL